MSESPSGQKPPGRFSRAVSRIVGWPFRLSTAGKAAMLMAAFLILAAVVVWAVFLTEPGHVAPRHAFTLGRILLVIALLVLIPLATYYAVRLWLEGDRSRFPEIDFAWNAGIEAMRRSGLALDELPLFLVLGSPGERVEQAMAAASGDEFRIRGVPEGSAPLHWYVSPDRAYLFLTEPSWVSGLAALAARRTQAAALPPDALAALAAAASPAPSALANPTGTIALGDFLAAYGSSARSAAAGAVPSIPGEQHRGTLSFDALTAARSMPSAGRHSSSELPPSVALEQPALLPGQESARRLERLEYVARKLRLGRRPLCAANGILVLIPVDLIHGEANEKEELVRAIRSDLTTLQNAVGVRAPVTALLTGMEQESGFQELVRRVGRDRAAAQRFGRRFDIRALPTPAEMAATSAHVCGAFEDWIYSLFREEDALARPGTARLYGLLCHIRSHLKAPLTEVLARGFGHDPSLRSDDLPFLFSGCYVAATGEAEDRRAFVKGVFEKLDSEQEEVEWTPSSLATERRYRLLTGVIAVANVALTISLVAMAAYWVVG
ncbi:MAG: type VI secretion protein IcmF/TssM N-terminal domain-containing protein [Planctomycetaceae bacterium]